MKPMLPLLLALLVLCPAPASAEGAPLPSGTAEISAGTAGTAVGAKVVVHYLHGSARCSNCLKFEKWGKEAVDTAFAGELKSGRLEWRVFNTDEEAHAHYVEDFQLYTKAIVVGEMKDGKLARWKNLDKIWDLLGDEAAFKAYVTAETRAFLDGK